MLEVAARDLALYFAFMLAAMSVLSLPLAPATLLAVKTSPPLLVALVAAVATAGAAVFDYHFVRRAFRLNALLKLREHRLFAKAERWAKVAPFMTTALFAGLPLPYLFARVLIPLSGYPLPRYAAAVSLGRFGRVFVIATFGTFVDVPDWILLALLGAGVALSLGAAIARQIQARRATSRPDP